MRHAGRTRRDGLRVFDASTFGYVVDYAADPPKQVAAVTVRMRSATEH